MLVHRGMAVVGIIYWPGMAQMSAVIPCILVASQPPRSFCDIFEGLS